MIERIEPWIMLQDQTKIKMTLFRREGNVYHFQDDDGLADLKLILREKGNTKAVYVDARIEPAKYQYRDLNYLNSECAIVLEIPFVGDMKGYMAEYLYSEFWCEPQFGTELSMIPKDTQALLWEKTDGRFGFLLPVCDETYKCALNGSENGIQAKLFSWYSGLITCQSLAFLYSEGDNPFSLAEQCVEVGLEWLNNGCKPREERRYPEVFDTLGWCSWDALQIRVGTEGLLMKCEEFKQKEIPVRWAIIDDMWAEVKGLNEVPEEASFKEMVDTMHRSKLYSFEADPVRFPDGLKACIDQMKTGYGLKVGMWHPTTGYWKGIDPDGPIAKDCKEWLTETGDGRIVPNPQLDKAFSFYNAFHTFLNLCGTDFVKIDNQSFIRGFLKGKMPVGQAARNVHQAIESSVGANFDNRLINCMGMASENMWNRPTSAISRCSDDFLPENRAWFIKHILQCSYNSFVQGNFLWCDWDMWWTDDGQAVKNSVLRAVSGGPIYVSDKIGRSVKAIIMPLVFGDGTILRCDRPAMPTKDCLTIDNQKASTPFKVWNRCGESGIVAAFNLNINNEAVSGSLSIGDVDGIEGERFAVYAHFGKTVHILEKNDKLDIRLEDQERFELFVIVPIRDGFAPIGLANKFISPKAVIHADASSIVLVEGGEFAFVSEREVKEVVVNGKSSPFHREDRLFIVDCGSERSKVSMQLIY